MFSKRVFMKHVAEVDTALCWKIRADVATLHTDLLSARCTIDRLRLSMGDKNVARCAEQTRLNEITSNLVVISAFLDRVQMLMAENGTGEPGND